MFVSCLFMILILNKKVCIIVEYLMRTLMHIIVVCSALLYSRLRSWDEVRVMGLRVRVSGYGI